MKNMRCYTIEDFQKFYKAISGPETQNGGAGIIDTGTAVENIWKNFISKSWESYKEKGFIDIHYDCKTECFMVKGKRGRPFKELGEVKARRITVRLDSILGDKLDKYCSENNVDESEAIRRAILKL